MNYPLLCRPAQPTLLNLVALMTDILFWVTQRKRMDLRFYSEGIYWLTNFITGIQSACLFAYLS
jgi:hypothetical protein